MFIGALTPLRAIRSNPTGSLNHGTVRLKTFQTRNASAFERAPHRCVSAAPVGRSSTGCASACGGVGESSHFAAGAGAIGVTTTGGLTGVKAGVEAVTGDKIARVRNMLRAVSSAIVSSSEMAAMILTCVSSFILRFVLCVCFFLFHPRRDAAGRLVRVSPRCPADGARAAPRAARPCRRRVIRAPPRLAVKAAAAAASGAASMSGHGRFRPPPAGGFAGGLARGRRPARACLRCAPLLRVPSQLAANLSGAVRGGYLRPAGLSPPSPAIFRLLAGLARRGAALRRVREKPLPARAA